ncbi:hypothetical protein NDU88_000711 [Pleurodeles waltl]|uniref:Uncharacterized protein n=1 Tax=Pleurodeles waltl TaxID=8319 RepID=A0AAV7Q3Y3_PLEWA|nr:hypothetical protein NDU88_000711 [Pleurodeles waltl]
MAGFSILLPSVCRVRSLAAVLSLPSPASRWALPSLFERRYGRDILTAEKDRKEAREGGKDGEERGGARKRTQVGDSERGIRSVQIGDGELVERPMEETTGDERQTTRRENRSETT